MIDLLFTILILATCAYACLAGGKEGRWATFMLLGGALATIPAAMLDPSWSRTQIPVLVVDTALLGGLLWLALRSNRFWPMWLAALHLAGVATHIATLIGDQGWSPIAYRMMQSFWALPMQFVMAVGIALDRQRGLTPDATRGAVADI